MQQVIKRSLWIVGLALSLSSAWGFALLGPVAEAPGPGGGLGVGDSWEQPIIFYNPLTSWDTAPIGPKNIGEFYRRNCPVLYYACDASFLGYFGSNGMVEIDKAFDIMNTIPNADDIDLSAYPLKSQSINYRAKGAGLVDVKSVTLHLLMEQMGLVNPVRYTWTLHSRYILPGGTCTAGDVVYLVVQRNFEITPTPLNQIQYSSYVNGTLYSYIIAEYCESRFSPFGPQEVLADAVEFAVDPLDENMFTPVAAGDGGWIIENPANPPFRPPLFEANALYPFAFGLFNGSFYTGLTRDDVAGLKYMLRTNNIVWESPAPGAVLTGSTVAGGSSLGTPYLLYTSNYNAFASTALTNAPAALQALFPGLAIVTSSNYFVVVATPNVVAYYTNSFVLGNPPVLVVTTNGYTYTGLQNYAYTFANLNIISNLVDTSGNIIITNAFSTNTSAQLVTVQVQQSGVLGNPLVTNTSYQTVTMPTPSGEYYIDTNYACGPVVFGPQPAGFPITNVVVTTNLLVTASNSAGYFYSQSLLIYSTTHVYVVQSPVCSIVSTSGVANATGLYEGIQKVSFVKSTFDSLIGQFYQPITNSYSTIFISGSKAMTNRFMRVVTTPDFLFRAEDMSGPLPFFSALSRSFNFTDVNRLPGQAGPGTINPPTTITYNKVGDVFLQGPLGTTNAFLKQDPTTSILAWGSFDNTTNDPVVYPNGTSIQNLENMILVQLNLTAITNLSALTGTNIVSLPDGTNGVSYPPVMFSASGGSFIPPFTWVATGLPGSLSLTSTNSVGVISGVPLQTGGFTFSLRLTDSLLRTTTWTYPITIQPHP
jgi:hypothetical protein